MNKRHFIYSIPMILLLIIAVAGWFATDYLGNKARQEIISEGRASVLTLSIYVHSTFTTIEGAVKSLSGSPWIAPALLSKSDKDIEHANSALDRYNFALNASVSYLMDANGMTVASTNRKDPDSFVGKSYRFRPYFQEAAKGQPYHYFALGITSAKRGFYASYPVQNRLGKVLGVVTMKKDLDDMGIFFRKYPFCFFISPDGIIFLSSKPEMVLKSFWTLDKTTQEKLMASRQFGNKFSETVTEKEIADGTDVTLEGKDYFVSRKVIGSDGWSIVMLNPIDRIWIYKLIGILATIFVCFLIMVFSGISYITDRSQKAIRQSEESKHLLLNAAGEGIFGVDASGLVTFINPAALRMLGFAEEEMLGKSAHALIHHSHEDGSNYPVEDCPMYASYNKAVDSHVEDEMLWRKDGSSFHVDYFSTSITKDGKVLGAVVTFRDITERKRAEEEIKQSEAFLNTLLSSIPIPIFYKDRDGRYTGFNSAYEKFFGATREKLIGKTVFDISPPELAKIYHAKDNDLLESGVEQKYESQVKNTLGVTRDVIFNKAVFTDSKGTVNGLIGAILDITERKQAEEKLQESETSYRQLFETSPAAIYRIDYKSGRFIRANELLCEHLGYSQEEITTISPYDILTEESKKLFLERLEKIALGIEVPNTVEFEGFDKQGKQWTLLLSIKNIYDTKGNVVAADVVAHDITERKQADKQLKESENKYRLLAENVHDVIFVLDMNLKYTYVSPSVKALRGYEPEEVLKQSYTDILTPSSLDLAKKVLSEIIDLEKIKHAEITESRTLQLEMKRKDGTTVWTEVKFSAIRDENQQLVGILGVTRDIAERKQAEKALHEKEEKYRTILENIQEGYFEVDLNGNFTFFNDSICRILGYPQEEMMGMNNRQYTDKEQSKILYQAFNKVYSTGKPAKEFDWQIIRKDGTNRYIEVSVSLQINSSGKPIGFRGIAHDITERKRMQATLQESEERYRVLVENARDIIFRTDNMGRFTFANPVSLLITGYSEEEIIGKHYKMLVRPDKYKEVITLLVSQYENRVQNTYHEFPIITKDGHEIWLGQNTQLLVKDDHVSGFQAVARDITDRKMMEAEILALSITDQLTGLYNRRGFLSLAAQQLKLAKRNKSGMLLFFIDMDGLKWINDTLGHEEGDKALIETATLFKETFRTSDIIARMGGDEYVALAIDITETNSEIITGRLQSLIDKRNNQENRRYRLSISIGYSCYDPENPCSIDDLIERADKLMYEQKQNKKSLPL